MQPFAMTENRYLDTRASGCIVYGRRVKEGDGYTVDGH